MKKRNRFGAVLLAGVLVFSMSGCRVDRLIQNQPDTSSSSSSSSDQWHQQTADDNFVNFLTEVYDGATLYEDSLSLHYAVDTSGGIYLQTFSEDSLEEQLEDYQSLYKKLKTYQKDELTEENQLLYEELQLYLGAHIEQWEKFPYHRNILGVDNGAFTSYLSAMEDFSFTELSDVEFYLDLLEESGDYLDSIREYLQKQVDAGLFMTKGQAEQVRAQLDSVTLEIGNTVLERSFSEKLEQMDLSADKKAELTAKNNKILDQTVYPAIDELSYRIGRLMEDAPETISLAQRKNGKEFYRSLIRTDAGLSDPVDELIEMTDAAFAEQMEKLNILLEQDPGLLSREEAFSYGEEYEPSHAAELLESNKTQTLSLYPEIADVPVVFVEVDESMQDIMPDAYYIQMGAASGDDLIAVNSTYAEPMMFYSTIAHEGYPGHLYQTNYLDQNKRHDLEPMLETTGFSEGWASYAQMESYAYNPTWGSDTALREGMAISDMANSMMCLRIEIGVNYEGWSLQTVKDNYPEDDPEYLTLIYDSVQLEPTYYMHYFGSMLKIYQLRERAQEALGDAFDSKAFHELLLNNSAAPFALIESRLEEYLEAQGAPQQDTPRQAA